MQPHKQANVFSRSTRVRAVTIGEGDIEAIPVNFASHHALRMVEIQVTVHGYLSDEAWCGKFLQVGDDGRLQEFEEVFVLLFARRDCCPHTFMITLS